MKTKAFTLFCLSTLFMACSGEDSEETNNGGDNGGISNTLHMSFDTPDWDRFINCEQLDLYPIGINETTNYVSATSASTRETFYFSMPADSTAMVASGNLKKYKITEVGQTFEPFQFAQKLPITDGAQTWLASVEGLDDNSSYNEVVAIEYVSSDDDFALFRVKCRYKMDMYEVGNESNIKPVTGTFHFKVRTSKD